MLGFPPLTGYLRDFWSLDLSSGWMELSNATAPSARVNHGFAATSDKLFVFGGQGASGDERSVMNVRFLHACVC